MRPLAGLGGPSIRAALWRRPARFDISLRRTQFSSTTFRSSNKPPSDAEKSEPIPVANTVAPLPLWQRLGPLTRAATAYARAQKRRPYATQFGSALVIYLFADLSAQSINSDDDGIDIDPKRTARSLVIGGIAAIPSYKWFIWLSHNFNYSSHMLSLAVKIVVSHIIFTPIFNTYFFGAQAVLSGCSPQGVWNRIKETVPTSMINSVQFWPPVTAFSFTFVPIEHRAVFSGVIAIGWQTYLALLNRRAELKAKAEAEEAKEAMTITTTTNTAVEEKANRTQDTKLQKAALE